MFFAQNDLILMELDNLTLIEIFSPRANGPLEPKNVKLSLKLAELRASKGVFSFHEKALAIQNMRKEHKDIKFATYNIHTHVCNLNTSLSLFCYLFLYLSSLFHLRRWLLESGNKMANEKHHMIYRSTDSQ